MRPQANAASPLAILRQPSTHLPGVRPRPGGCNWVGLSRAGSGTTQSNHGLRTTGRWSITAAQARFTNERQATTSGYGSLSESSVASGRAGLRVRSSDRPCSAMRCRRQPGASLLLVRARTQRLGRSGSCSSVNCGGGTDAHPLDPNPWTFLLARHAPSGPCECLPAAVCRPWRPQPGADGKIAARPWLCSSLHSVRCSSGW